MRLLRLPVLVVLIATTAIVGCSGGQGNTNTAANGENRSTAANTPNSNAGTAATGYPPKVSDDFVAGCEGQGADPEVCKCVFEKIQQRYTFEEFQAIGSEINAGQPPADFIEFSDNARAECLKQAK